MAITNPIKYGNMRDLQSAGTKTRTMSSFTPAVGMTSEGQKNSLMNKMLLGGGVNSLNSVERERARSLLSPDEMSQYGLGKTPGGAGGAGGASATAGADSMSPEALLDMYQKGLGAGASKTGTETPDDKIRLMREANALDLDAKTKEQKLQMEGQKVALDQAQQARAKERETEANLQRRQQSTERANAMMAFKSL